MWTIESNYFNLWFRIGNMCRYKKTSWHFPTFSNILYGKIINFIQVSLEISNVGIGNHTITNCVTTTWLENTNNSCLPMFECMIHNFAQRNHSNHSLGFPRINVKIGNYCYVGRSASRSSSKKQLFVKTIVLKEHYCIHFLYIHFPIIFHHYKHYSESIFQ